MGLFCDDDICCRYDKETGYDKAYPVTTGMEQWTSLLKKQFPDDHKVTKNMMTGTV